VMFPNKRVAILIGVMVLVVTLLVSVQVALSEADVDTGVAPESPTLSASKPLACALPPPELVAPSDGAATGLVPIFQYKTLEGVKKYDFQLATEPDFSPWEIASIITLFTPPAGGTIYNFDPISENLSPDTTYYWRMASRCENNDRGNFSPTYSFETSASGTPPSIPDVPSPVDGAAVGSIRVNFVFEPVSGLNKYEVWFYDSPTGDNTSSSASSSAVVTREFDPETTIYWRARVRNDYAYSQLTGIRLFTTPPVTATATILPGSGGTLTPDPGNISIEVPPNAVTATTTLSYTLQPVPTQDIANFLFAGRAFTLEAWDDASQPVTTFNQPYTMTVVYDDYDLLVAGAFPSELNLAYWDGVEWQNILPCAGCSNDTENRTITVVLDHLSEFALLADTSERLNVFIPYAMK
jgi:hypothetical protein